jgi:hypothetical protein
MKKNSSNSTPNLPLSDELKKMILSYMEACNAEDYAKADSIMFSIKKYNESHS